MSGKITESELHPQLVQKIEEAGIVFEVDNSSNIEIPGVDETLIDINNKYDQVSTQMEHIVNVSEHFGVVPLSKDTIKLKEFLLTIENNSIVKFPKGYYEINDVLILKDKSNVKIDLHGTHIKQLRHGFGVLELDNCTNVKSVSGIIEGSGTNLDNIFDENTQTLTNEKIKYISTWGFDRNDSKTSSPEFSGGHEGNCGFGVLIRNGCSNVEINKANCFNFNYCGIAIGFLGDGNNPNNLQNYSKNIKINNCLCSKNFDTGIQVMAVDGYKIINCECLENGHPNATINDKDINPGYGITCRSSNSFAKNGTISNSRFIGNKRKGIDTHGSENLTIENNYVSDSYLVGIALAHTGYTIKDTYIKNNLVKNCGISLGAIGDIIGFPLSGIWTSSPIEGSLIIENNDVINCANIDNNNSSLVGIEVKNSNGYTSVKGNTLIESGLKNNMVVKCKDAIIKNNEFKFIENKASSTIFIAGESSYLNIIKSNYIKGSYNRIFELDTIQNVLIKDNDIIETTDVARPISYTNNANVILKDNRGITKGGLLGINDIGTATQQQSQIRFQCYNNGNFGILGGNKSIVNSITRNETSITITFANNISVELLTVSFGNSAMVNRADIIYLSSLNDNVAVIQLKKDGVIINPTTILVSNEQFIINVSYYE